MTTNKMWVAGLVSFVGQLAVQWAGIEISPEVQAGIVSLILGGLVYLVPNAPEK